MTITVYEQARIPVSARHLASAGAIDPIVAAALVDLGARTGTRLATWDGPTAIRMQQFVGSVRVAGVSVEILPKLDGLDEPASVRESLLGMLAVTEELDLRPADQASYHGTTGPVVTALARLYCRQLLEAARRGLRQDYRLDEGDLPFVRGRIDWGRQGLMASMARTDFPCLYDERSADIPLNQVLKEALLVARTMLEGDLLGGLVTELLHAVDNVTRATRTPAELARVRTDRMSRHLHPLLTLAKLLLGAKNPDLSKTATGVHDTYAVLWDMNVLFEEYVGRTARRALAPLGLTVDLQSTGGAHLARELPAGRGAFLLRPDILVRDSLRPVVVADTKWKRLDPSDTNLGIVSGDVYQVLSYAHRYDVERAILLFPHHPRLGAPGHLRRYQTVSKTSTPVQLDVVSVDLARLETVGPTVRSALMTTKNELPVNATGLSEAQASA